ncbi:MAG TPA: hypothetical protein VHY37_11785 [Tepidisphaeraceae bacterium]|jgi:hypothetical protein|nr:hypothetical protein [Tepidisphaeraceae bacterium]
MSDWLFAAPLWLPTMIAVAGVLVFIEGNRRTSKPIRNAGVAIFLLAIAVFTLSRVVDTDKKKVTRESQQLIDAVRTGKWNAVSALLEPDATLSLPDTTAPLYNSGAQIVSAAREATGNYPLTGTFIQSLQLDQTGTEMTATMTLRSSFETYPTAPIPSSWQLDWVKDGNTWKVQGIHALEIGDRTGPDMGRNLPRQ